MIERKGGWILTYTGRQFWPLDPRPEDVDIVDIAHALSNICRFTGHCREFYSVAQHSVHVSDSVPLCDAVWGLMHDAAEAYLADLAAPLKRGGVLGREYGAIEMQLMKVVCQRFNLTLEQPASVSVMDVRMLLAEKRDLMDMHSPHLWKAEQDGVDALSISVHGWMPQAAENAFLNRAAELGIPTRLQIKGDKAC